MPTAAESQLLRDLINYVEVAHARSRRGQKRYDENARNSRFVLFRLGVSVMLSSLAMSVVRHMAHSRGAPCLMSANFLSFFSAAAEEGGKIYERSIPRHNGHQHFSRLLLEGTLAEHTTISTYLPFP